MRYGDVEIRQSAEGPQLRGVVLQEGRAATGGRRELFAPGSVTWPDNGMGILLAHREAPHVQAMPERQSDGRIVVATPATPEIREAVEGGRRFMSVEFHAIEERTTAGGVREILQAYVPSAALVDAPEYDTTGAEVRQRFTGSLRTYIPINRRADCRCAGQGAGRDVIEIEFDEGAFDRVLAEIADGRREVLAISRGAGDVVATTGTGSLALSAAGSRVNMRIDALDTAAGRNVEELVAAGVEVYARPVIDFDASEFDVEGTVAIVRDADFAYILVKPTDRREGLEKLTPATRRRNRKGRGPVELRGPVEAILRRSGRGRRLWL